MADAINLESPIILCYPPSHHEHIDLMTVTHTVRNAEINDHGLEAEFTPIKKDMDYSGFVFRPCGLGTIDNNGIVTDYQFKGINIVLKENDSFGKTTNSDES